MIGIIQRFGMATELPQRKNTVFLLYHQKILWKIGIDINIIADVDIS